MQVARSLVNMYNQVANGDLSYVETLKQQHENSVAKSLRDQGAGDFMGEDDSSSSSSSSDDDDEENDGCGDMDVDGEDPPASIQNEPLVDEDGFTVVQRRGRRR